MKIVNKCIPISCLIIFTTLFFVGCGSGSGGKSVDGSIFDTGDSTIKIIDDNTTDIPDTQDDDTIADLNNTKIDNNTTTVDNNSTTEPVNVAPELKEETISITSQESGVKIFNVLSNVTDPEGKTLKVVSVIQKDATTLSGNISYDNQNVSITTPNVDLPTYYHLEATVADDENLTVTYDINLTVTDMTDDAKLIASEITAETNVAIGEDLNLSIELSDADGIDSVEYEVYEKSDTSYSIALISGIFQDENLDGNYQETLQSSSLSEGNYTTLVNITGYIGGEHEDSKAVKIHYFNTVVPDLEPDTFDFPDIYSTPVSTYATTETITVSGINLKVTATTSNGTLIINGVDTNEATYTVRNGDRVAARVLSPDSLLIKLWTTVTIGEKSDQFGLLQAPLVMW